MTAVTLINGRSHGDAPKRPQQSYGPPPMMGHVPGKMPDMNPATRPFRRPPPGSPPVPGSDLGHTPPPDLRDSPDSAGPRRHKGHREINVQIPGVDVHIPGVNIAIPGVPDFSKDMRGPENKVLQDGRMELAARNYGIAVGLFTTAIKLSPDDYHAYFYRGAAYLGAGNPKQAEADYTKVIELRPDDAQGWYQLGIAMENQHRMKEALGRFLPAPPR